jgi:hypothetical protein
MAQIAPPLPPLRVALADRDGPDRLQTRIWVLWATFLSILACAWFCSLGPISAIIALVVEKHVLVALLALWIDVTTPQRAGWNP